MASIHGTISHAITIGAAGTYTYPSPLMIAADGYVSNSGSDDAVFSSFANATLNNRGTVMATGTFDGVHFTAGGYIRNTGLIGGGRFGIYISGTIGTLANFGTIKGVNGYGAHGVSIQAGGTIVNGNAAALIVGGAADADSAAGIGVRMSGGGSIGNAGMIFGGGGGFDDSGRSGAAGVSLSGVGSIGNAGVIAGGRGAESAFDGSGGGGGIGIVLSGGGEIANTGAIVGGYGGLGGRQVGGAGGAGISLSNGGSIENNGEIEGGGGGSSVFAYGAPGGAGISIAGGGSIENTGAIAGGRGGTARGSGGAGGAGIVFVGGGDVINAGTIVGGSGGGSQFSHGGTGGAGIGLSNGGEIVNTGTIVGGQAGFSYSHSVAGSGIVLSGGIIINGTAGLAGAQILGGIGIQASGTAGATVTNYGTVIGSDGIAISFAGGGANLLALGAGYLLSGTVQGSTAAGSSDTLKLLGGAGQAVTVNYNGIGLTNFEQVLFGTGGYAGLLVSNTGTVGITIGEFDQTTEVIDLTGIGANGTITYSNTLTDRITVTGSLGSVMLQFDSIDGLIFTTGGDGGSGTELSIACFCRGTLIQTEAGEVAVEDLAIGDRAITHFGEARTIHWIGRRAYDGRFVAGNTAVLPICISAGALADGVPARDLWVSPEHSLYFDGVLAQAAHLVNGLTIIQAEAVQRVEYFHVELDGHDILVADGAPAESYVDCDNRRMFENGAEFAAVYPDDDRPRWQFCLPRLEAGSVELATIRAALLARAERLGHHLNTDPDLHLLVGGAVIRPEVVNDCLYRFTVPAGSSTVRLASRSTVPAETTAGAGDVRRLGVALGGLLLRDADLRIEAAHSHAALDDGFHPNEETHRWTGGLAQIPAAWLRCFAGAFTLEVRLASRELAYPVPPGGELVAAA